MTRLISRFTRFAVVVSLIVATASSAALAADYWVGPRGSDKGRGSKTSLWATLQFAADHVRPGDVVHVLDGNYTGFFTTRGGTPAARITFLAEGDQVRITNRNGQTPDGINLEGARFVTIDGFITNEMPRAGVRITHADGAVVRRVRADQNGAWGIFSSFSNDVIIEYNVTSRSRKEHGIYFSNSGDRPVIRGNVAFGNRDCGIHMNGDKNAGGDGIITGAIVDSNTVYGNGTSGGSAINADGVQNSKFVNNVIYDNHKRGISLFQIDGKEPSKDNVVAHNTIIMAADSRWGIIIKNGSTGNRVFNNIVLHEKGAQGDLLTDEVSRAGLVCDNNLYTGRFTTNDGDSTMDLAKWRAATGGDAHSALATPETLFIDPAQGDFHLRAGSLAIDKADSRYSPRLDRDARPRDRGSRPDLGAYESGTPPESKKEPGTPP
jgi:hypothetical protein